MKLGSGRGCSDPTCWLELPCNSHPTWAARAAEQNSRDFLPFPSQSMDSSLSQETTIVSNTPCSLYIQTHSLQVTFGCFFSTSPSPALSLPIVSNYNTHQNFFQAALSSSQYRLKLTGDECDLYLTRLASHSRHVGTTQECQRIMYNTKLDKCKDRFK